MMLYAHYDRDTKRNQLLMDHLQQVGQRMLWHIAALEFPDLSRERMTAILYGEGFYHDVAKAMCAFQRYLRTGQGGMEKNHALLSAAIWSRQDDGENCLAKYLSVLAIARHHGDLEQIIQTKGQLFSQLACQYQDYWQQIVAEKTEQLFDKNSFIDPASFVRDFKGYLEDWEYELEDATEEGSQDSSLVAAFFMLQYFFSKLIWADKTDSASLCHEPFLSGTLKDVEAYIFSKNSAYAAVDDKREAIRQNVLHRIISLSNDAFKEQRIYLLTAPTGTGKTLTSVCAAVLIAERLEHLYHEKPHIITAMPFVNILEQTFMDYKEIFGQDQVLAQYGAADLHMNFDETKGLTLQNNMLILSAWEKPVIITTFVQFFECILGVKNNRLIKLNKLAGSIVILDEVQAMPIEQYAVLGAVIYHVSRHYGTRFILMTATQPEIITFANRLLPGSPMVGYELLPDYQKYYQQLTRTRLVPAFDLVHNDEELIDFIEETKPAQAAALVVVNTISQSIRVYHMLKERGFDVLYLSTNLTPHDRKQIIRVAQRLLRHKYPFVLVSTQTIEAGVDLDFDIGYRDFAPLESLIQVAGRINRSGKKAAHAPVYIFDTGSSQYVYGTYFRQETRKLLVASGEIGEEQYLQLIQKYYKLLAEQLSCSDELYEAMKSLDYETISGFHIVPDEQDIRTVLILYNPHVEILAVSYADLLKSRETGFEKTIRLKQLLNELARYTVDVRLNKLVKNMPCKFSDIYDVSLDWYVVQRNEKACYYNRTGFVPEHMNTFEY